MIYRRQEKCKACESEISETPIQLPCKDVICTACYNEMKLVGTSKCRACKKQIPESFDPQHDNKNEWVNNATIQSSMHQA